MHKDCGYDGAPGWVSRGRPPPPPTPSPIPGDQCPVSQCDPKTDDTSWRVVDVPHDFMVERNFTPSASISQGYLPFGVGWYRRHLVLPNADKGRAMWLDFDGVMISSQVYLNGRFLGNHTSGYTPFRFNLSETLLNWDGAENVLAVRADATSASDAKEVAWYYDGAGIYRHVWLTVADVVHIAPLGVYAPGMVTGAIQQVHRHSSTTGAGLRGSTQSFADSVINCSVDVVNDGPKPVAVVVEAVVFDASASVVGSQRTMLTSIPPGGTTTAAVVPEIVLKNASLWSVDHPTLYTVQTTVMVAGSAVDAVNTTIGVRKVEFDPDRGFLLNDVPTKILGACNHQDFAGVGVAVPDALQAFRVAKMKQTGINGWRTAHNPPTPALLDATVRWR